MVFYYLRNQFSTSFSFKIFEPFIAPPYTRAKVPNSFSRRMNLLCNTLTEHDELFEFIEYFDDVK